MDARTQKNLDSLDPKAVAIFLPFLAEAKALAAAEGIEYVAISGHRTWKEQDALYWQGRTTPGNKVTNARGGSSNHNFGIAMDFGCFVLGKYLDGGNKFDAAKADKMHKKIGAIAAKHGLDWGGGWNTFKDYPHFGVAHKLSMAEMRFRYTSAKTIFPV